MAADPKPNGANRENETRITENLVLIEWTSAIYGIFWGVWLGFFADKLISQCNSTPLATIITFLRPEVAQIVFPVLLISWSVLLVGYTYFLVKWLWVMRNMVPGTPYEKVFVRLRTAAFFCVFTFGAMLVLAGFCSIDLSWIWIGLWATAGWVTVVSMVVLIDRRGWT